MQIKKQIELHQLNELFKRIAALSYEEPSDIIESERPDFVVTISGQRIGVEVTRSIYEEHGHASALHSKYCPDHCIITTHLHDRGQRRSKDELLSEILDLNSKWKDSEQDMRDWRDKVASSLERKRAKLSKSGYKLFDKNWLLIYDEPGLANDSFTYDRACRYAAAIFATPYASHLDFDTVFLLSKRYLFRWHDQKLSLDYAPQALQKFNSTT